MEFSVLKPVNLWTFFCPLQEILLKYFIFYHNFVQYDHVSFSAWEMRGMTEVTFGL